jgi:hypothetical protein
MLSVIFSISLALYLKSEYVVAKRFVQFIHLWYNTSKVA